jgi:trehalose 6-phosphate synthase/phosphatase
MMNKADQVMRHEKHWAYVKAHTVEHWAGSFTEYVIKATEGHQHMTMYTMGLGLDTFRVIALTPSFKKLTHEMLRAVYPSCERRLILCDYDGTLVPTNQVRIALQLDQLQQAMDPSPLGHM